MSEQLHDTSAEKAVNTQELSPEQLESYLRAEARVERGIENKVESAEKSEANARHEALKQAISVESGSAEKKKGKDASSPAKRRHGVVSKKEREASYKQNLKQVQAELKPRERAFSKVIHNPVVEKTSEVVGNTVARPNAILAGGMVAFFLVLAVYLVAKFYGYTLSGFETIGAFIIGFALGILYDFFRVMITGKKS